jgi:hypothetical protein
METQATVYVKEGWWVAETKGGIVHKILNQSPFHGTLCIGRDENRMAIVDVMDSHLGKRAEFKRFIQ